MGSAYFLNAYYVAGILLHDPMWEYRSNSPRGSFSSLEKRVKNGNRSQGYGRESSLL
jgi:hypothetical protein